MENRSNSNWRILQNSSRTFKELQLQTAVEVALYEIFFQSLFLLQSLCINGIKNRKFTKRHRPIVSQYVSKQSREMWDRQTDRWTDSLWTNWLLSLNDCQLWYHWDSLWSTMPDASLHRNRHNSSLMEIINDSDVLTVMRQHEKNYQSTMWKGKLIVITQSFKILIESGNVSYSSPDCMSQAPEHLSN